MVNEEIRRKAWPLLLNTNLMVETSESLMQDCSWKTLAKPKHRDSDQIEKDINRSLNTFEECRKWNKSIKEIKREQLSEIMHAIINKNKDLWYYQGYHDFVSVFLLTLGQNLGFYCADIASNYVIRDFMYKTME